jgi:hypothetical protein
MLVDTESHNLYVDHYREGCDCDPHTVVQTTVAGKDFNISVPYCTADIGRSPLLDACDTLSKHTGYKIIRLEEAEEYVTDYTDGCLADFFGEVLPVVRGNFGNNYFLKREVLEFCSNSIFRRKLCKVCGHRKCSDKRFCSDNKWDFESTYREYKGSYVYFLFHPATTLVKIGTSRDPSKRIKSHRSSNAGEIQTLGIVHGSDRLEKSIHQELEQWRAAGKKEWFYYTESVARYISRTISCVENLQKDI